MSGKLKVLLVDDHNLFRSGVRALLARQPDIDVVGEAADGLDGVKQAALVRHPEDVETDVGLDDRGHLAAAQLAQLDAVHAVGGVAADGTDNKARRELAKS